MRNKICTKRIYTEDEAQGKINRDTLASLNNNRVNRRPQVHKYHCMICGFWHTTTIANAYLKT
jgi:hypothetical protein